MSSAILPADDNDGDVIAVAEDAASGDEDFGGGLGRMTAHDVRDLGVAYEIVEAVRAEQESIAEGEGDGAEEVNAR
ncbi:MAG TPA: hypothetical protein VNN21_05720, partial [Dehalococcoidia bacterium]|nr:hypothetical protein [Dehalococcoidia bacterium]